jgi:hypothetical protein
VYVNHLSVKREYVTGRRQLRIYRQKAAAKVEVAHDADSYLKTDPLRGEGIPSHLPFVIEALSGYYRMDGVKLLPEDLISSIVVRRFFALDEMEDSENGNRVPPRRWQRGMQP